MNPKSYLAYTLGYQLFGKSFLSWQRHSDERKLRAIRPAPDDPLNPPLVGTARMKELMSRHYLEGRYANGVRKVAWVTSGAPIEVLRALDFFLIYPENHAALCGARRHAEGLAVEAENAGYSRDICSYARTDIGAALSGRTPMGKLPRPDLLVCCTNICQTVLYWYRVLAAHFGVPLYVVDTPFLYEKVADHQLDYVLEQIEGLIPVAEKVAGRRVSRGRLQEIMEQGKDCAELWLEIMDRAQHRPSPITAFDGFINMGPIVDLRGEPETFAFYKELLREIDRRIEQGVGAIRDERKRVLWDNLPVWYKIGKLSRHLGAKGVNVIVSTYTYAWGELAPMMDASDPMRSAARVYLHPILNRSTGDKLRSMREMVARFQLDGAILHSDRSCKPYSLGQIDQRDNLANDLGVPAVLLEADHNDPRVYSDEQADARLDAFVETMEAA
ncbi:MAG: 2-hydroxyacyl-CoA dehydratase [Deltaproteobacteria bacterium]|nr:2-hydroxyacyl-CoA dehydratase [Deltaproteobacteria bacterium]